MKKYSLVLLCLGFSALLRAQISLPKTANLTKAATSTLGNFIAPPAIGDITGTSSKVVNQLTSQLGLPSAQTGPLNNIVSGFLKQKQGIMGLAGSQPAAYLQKLAPMQKGLFSQLKGVMGAAAFSKFLGMKPKGSAIAGNALSNLFF
ncbi:MAG: hypothetical protein ACK54Y_01020 [Bacteroidota bacterium]